MENLKGRSILFFSPKFFSYEKEIKKKLEELGAFVKWFDDRPSNNFTSKALIRLNKNFIKKRTTNYYDNILKQLQSNKTQFDYVFFLNPEAIAVDSLGKIKNNFFRAKFILYMWDSFQNRKGTEELLSFFDSKFTFDPSDAKKFNLKLRPLFYVDLYKARQTDRFDFDFLFIGTAHTDRYKFVNEIVSQLSGKYKIKLHFFLSSKYLFIAKKIFDKDFNTVRYRNISFESLTHKSNSELIHKSKIILDINHPKQLGLTMRTLEALGAQRKLITTNADVSKYDFYNENNILIINRSRPLIDADFLNSPFIPSDNEILLKYSLKGWINDLFDDLNLSV